MDHRDASEDRRSKRGSPLSSDARPCHSAPGPEDLSLQQSFDLCPTGRQGTRALFRVRTEEMLPRLQQAENLRLLISPDLSSFAGAAASPETRDLEHRPPARHGNLVKRAVEGTHLVGRADGQQVKKLSITRPKLSAATLALRRRSLWNRFEVSNTADELPRASE